MKKWVVVGCAVLALCAANGAADPDVVAYWPFGDQGFNDVSGNGYTLVGGKDAKLGNGFVSLFGTDAGNSEASMKTTSPMVLNQLPSLTVEFWIRWHSSDLTDQVPFMEVAADNYNTHPGAIGIQLGTKKVAGAENVEASKSWSMVYSGSSNPFGTGTALTKRWHHVAVVYPKGVNADHKLFIDGKDVSYHQSGYQQEYSTAGLPFHDDILYIGGRAGLGKFDGDLAKLRFVGRRMTAEEVAARFAASYPHASNEVEVVGAPQPYPCMTMTPAYGVSAHDLAVGEGFCFSAGADGWQIQGWNVFTNAFVDGEYAWLPYRSGEGAEGVVPYPGAAMRVEWLWPDVVISEVTANSATLTYGADALPAGTLVISVGTISNKLHTVWKRKVKPEGDSVAMTMLDWYTPHYYAKVQVKNGASVSYEEDFEFTLTDVSTVAYWPFGVHGLQDASSPNGLGYALSAGSEVSVGAHATFSGSTDENAMTSTSKLMLSQLEGLTIDYWVRVHLDEPQARLPFLEISENYNNHAGAVTIQQGLGQIGALERVTVTPVSYAARYSGADPFGTGDSVTQQWHHVVGVYPKGAYADFHLYVDGVKCTVADGSASTTGIPFYDDFLYLGGRAGNRKHRLDLDEVRFSGVKRTSAEVAELYAAGTFVRTGEARPALLTKGHVLVSTTEPVESYGFYPKVGAVAGRQAGETVILKAPEVLLNEDGTESRLSVLGATVSTNVPGTATWLPWRKVRRTECSFAYPEGDSAVRVDWNVGRRSGFLLMLK